MSEAVTVSARSLIALRGPGERLSAPRSRISAAQSGGYRSPYKGRGMEFEESRRYQPGDDIRNMDWRVTARTGHPHTKLYREERERPVLLAVDFRRPMFFATRGVFKSVMACRLAALLAWRSHYHGDRVGGILWSGARHRELRPRRGMRGVLNLVNGLCEFGAYPLEGADDVEEAGLDSLAMRLSRVAHPGSLVFLVSDFRGFTKRASELLAASARHSTLVLLMVYDSVEAELPPPGRYLVRDGERELFIDTRAAGHREHYQARFEQRRGTLSEFARRTAASVIECPTHADPVALLRHQLSH